MAIEPGAEAPDFTVKDQDGNDFTLSSLRGQKNVALVFFPFTFSGICQGELCQLRDDLSKYERADVQVVAISCDSRFAQKQWAEEQGYTFPVLADNWPHGKVAQAYGVFNDAVGAANRATFIIDKSGKVVDAFASENLGTPRGQESYEAALAKL